MNYIFYFLRYEFRASEDPFSLAFFKIVNDDVRSIAALRKRNQLPVFVHPLHYIRTIL